MLLDRVIDLSKYYPDIVKDTENFKELAKAENPEFNLALQRIEEALKDAFIEDATENGIKRYERIVKIYPKASDTLDDRKAAILLKYNLQLPYTYRTLEKKLKALYGVGGFKLELLNNEYILNIYVFSNNWNVFSNMADQFREIIPCNLCLNSKLINKVKSNMYFGAASFSGEIITNYPFAPKNVESKVNVYVSHSHYIDSEVITNYPKEG